MLRVYAQWKGTERRTAVKNVQVHGCYRSGIPVLIDSTQVAPDVLPDVAALRAALASSLRDSRIAIVVTPETWPRSMRQSAWTARSSPPAKTRSPG